MPTCINSSNENNGRRYIMYVLLVISSTFLFASIFLLTVDGITYSIYDDYIQFLDKLFAPIPMILLAVGAVTLILASLGFVGACKHDVNLYNVYYLLSLAYVMEILTAIAGFVLLGLVREMLIETMTRSIAVYPNYESVADGVDFVQRSLRCCGINGPNDWEGIFTPAEDEDTISVLVPSSCCAEFVGQKCEDYFLSGCLDPMQSIIGQNVKIIALGATIAAGAQILIVLLAYLALKPQIQSFRHPIR